jgi:hypothetical protein
MNCIDTPLNGQLHQDLLRKQTCFNDGGLKTKLVISVSQSTLDQLGMVINFGLVLRKRKALNCGSFNDGTAPPLKMGRCERRGKNSMNVEWTQDMMDTFAGLICNGQQLVEEGGKVKFDIMISCNGEWIFVHLGIDKNNTKSCNAIEDYNFGPLKRKALNCDSFNDLEASPHKMRFLDMKRIEHLQTPKDRTLKKHRLFKTSSVGRVSTFCLYEAKFH